MRAIFTSHLNVKIAFDSQCSTKYLDLYNDLYVFKYDMIKQFHKTQHINAIKEKRREVWSLSP